MKILPSKLKMILLTGQKSGAAEHNTSVSRILGDLLKQMKQQKTGYTKAMQQFLDVEAQPLKTSKRYPVRDKLHER